MTSASIPSSKGLAAGVSEHAVSQPTGRLAWIDAARGIGIILVVLGHVSRGLVTAGVPHDGRLVGLADFALYTFHMPLFFFLSGLWLSSIETTGRKAFLIRRAWTVAYPYVVWSLFQGGLIIAAGDHVNTPLTPGELAMIWIRPIGQFWFLYVLMTCHIAAAVLYPRRLVLGGLALVLFLGSGLLPGVLQAFAHQFLYYLLGWLVAPWLLRTTVSDRLAAVVGAGAIVCFAIACWLALKVTHDPETAWTFVVALCGVTATICAAMLCRRMSLIVFLGSASMTIYVLHIIAASGARVVVGLAPIHLSFAMHLAIGSTVGVLAPALAHVVGDRTGLLPWAGLAPLRRRRSPNPAVTGIPAAQLVTPETKACG